MDSLNTWKTVSLFLLGVVIACVAYVSMRPAAARNQTMPLPPLESAPAHDATPQESPGNEISEFQQLD